jgi:polar amino acid transport system substrate-binding protein
VSYLQENEISFQAYKAPLEGLRHVGAGKIDAFIYDAPILRYLIKQKVKGRVDVVPRTFLRQGYGLAMPERSPLREPINRVLLQKIGEPAWQDIPHRYLGV